MNEKGKGKKNKNERKIFLVKWEEVNGFEAETVLILCGVS